MKYLKRRQKLDEILKYSTRAGDDFVSVNDLYRYLHANFMGFTTAEITKALNKLLADNCIMNAEPGYYKITLKGEVLIEDGGYVAVKRRSIAKSSYRNYMQRYDNEHSVLFPWIIAIMGILIAYAVFRIGFLYYDWKIPF